MKFFVARAVLLIILLACEVAFIIQLAESLPPAPEEILSEMVANDH